MEAEGGIEGVEAAASPAVEARNDSITPYESYLVTLSVGPPANPVLFQVDSSSLKHIRFFAAALREDTFREGRERIIHFEEEDPAVFRRLVEFVNTNQCFPRHFKYDDPIDERDMFEVPCPVVRNLAGAEPEEYRRWLVTSMSCGAHEAADETHEIVKMVIETMCLGERYCCQALMNDCLDKIYDLPFGLREVTLLMELVLLQIPDTPQTLYLPIFA
ncbi:hypothetical protein BJ875DRAFT_489380 [Amylocarpus encephaloides]|uniref:BTB domain-containing protein n=1 Tax=Amylocarpus encephaloides TaxID=45428 RepID=A0A9P8C0J4_9HELO|nr:hypothetical protein BJ875DRAFT_489380 [Amylocarpus encephaloides]